jgi:hypothetical protein
MFGLAAWHLISSCQTFNNHAIVPFSFRKSGKVAL